MGRGEGGEAGVYSRGHWLRIHGQTIQRGEGVKYSNFCTAIIIVSFIIFNTVVFCLSATAEKRMRKLLDIIPSCHISMDDTGIFWCWGMISYQPRKSACKPCFVLSFFARHASACAVHTLRPLSIRTSSSSWAFLTMRSFTYAMTIIATFTKGNIRTICPHAPPVGPSPFSAAWPPRVALMAPGRTRRATLNGSIISTLKHTCETRFASETNNTDNNKIPKSVISDATRTKTKTAHKKTSRDVPTGDLSSFHRCLTKRSCDPLDTKRGLPRS